jgi:hypothetical protein
MSSHQRNPLRSSRTFVLDAQGLPTSKILSAAALPFGCFSISPEDGGGACGAISEGCKRPVARRKLPAPSPRVLGVPYQRTKEFTWEGSVPVEAVLSTTTLVPTRARL